MEIEIDDVKTKGIRDKTVVPLVMRSAFSLEQHFSMSSPTFIVEDCETDSSSRIELFADRPSKITKEISAFKSSVFPAMNNAIKAPGIEKIMAKQTIKGFSKD